ncbi:MAG TPA: pseudouridine synthase [Phycisphaerae bacterium]|nr:pseudouridine synthase [Phycisphaerae bacterium]
MATERIQKILAAAGYGARRACEQLVLDGRVAVNGAVVDTLPVLVDPERDHIIVDGKPIRTARHVYFLLNKPPGVFCTHNDPSGRTRAVDLLGGVRERVFPVGRLDAESTGLLIMTNDGALTQRLTHPRFAVPKTYHAEIAGCPTTETLDKFRAGVWLSEGKTAPAQISILHRQRDRAVLEVTLREGRNREIRRILAKLGHKVRRLTRVRMGKLSIRGLPLGAYRPLTPAEVKYLQSLAEHSPTEGQSARSRFGRRRERARRKSDDREVGFARQRSRSAGPSRREIKAGEAHPPQAPRKGGRRIILPD